MGISRLAIAGTHTTHPLRHPLLIIHKERDDFSY